MVERPRRGAPCLSVIVPAHDEAALIGRCLGALLASDPVPEPVQIIVVANGCSDDTARQARALGPAAEARGWALEVIETQTGSKPHALNLGDKAAQSGNRLYLDADVTVSPPLLRELVAALSRKGPLWASGRVRIAPSESRFSRAYGRFYARLPFIANVAPGCGLFAVNEAGRKRWGDWPAIISDDTFARLRFAPDERVQIDAPYDWPLVEGFGALVRVRRRQDRGVAEIARRFPDLPANDDKPAMTPWRLLRLMLAEPAGFLAYGAVRLVARLSGRRQSGWERGR